MDHFKRWLQLRLDFDSTTIQSFDDLRHYRTPTCVRVLLHCGLSNTPVHGTQSSIQYVTVQFQKYLPIPGQPNSVPFSCRQITHYTARIIVQRRLERQETPRDPVPAETISCSWTHGPTKSVWHSVLRMGLGLGLMLVTLCLTPWLLLWWCANVSLLAISWCCVAVVFLLKCAVQTYAWGKQGSNSEVARLMRNADDGFVVNENTTYAEVTWWLFDIFLTIQSCTGIRLLFCLIHCRSHWQWGTVYPSALWKFVETINKN